MKAFQSRASCDAVSRVNEHGGHGPIAFRRMLEQRDFNAPVDLVVAEHASPGRWTVHVYGVALDDARRMSAAHADAA